MQIASDCGMRYSADALELSAADDELRRLFLEVSAAILPEDKLLWKLCGLSAGQGSVSGESREFSQHGIFRTVFSYGTASKNVKKNTAATAVNMAVGTVLYIFLKKLFIFAFFHFRNIAQFVTFGK